MKLTDAQKSDLRDMGYYLDTCEECFGTAIIKMEPDAMREWIRKELFDWRVFPARERRKWIRRMLEDYKLTGGVPCDCGDGRVRRRG